MQPLLRIPLRGKLGRMLAVADGSTAGHQDIAQTHPSAARYRVLVVGDPPTDLSDKVSALHAKAVAHHVQQSRRAGGSQPNPEVQP